LRFNLVADQGAGPNRKGSDEMAEIWLSVVMPTYNGAAYLAQALSSLRVQEGGLGGVEILAVDDGSIDGTIETLREAQPDLPLRIINRPHTGNWVANANLGLIEARGDYVGILHQDDFWLPRRMAALRALTRDFPDAPLFIHPSWYVDRSGRKVGQLRCPLRPGRDGSAARVAPEAMVGRLLVQNFVAMPGHLFRRSSAVEAGGLDEALWYAADWDLWLKLSALGGAVYLPEPLTACRVHAASQTMIRRGTGRDVGSQLHTVLDRHLPIWRSYPAARTRGGSGVARLSRLSAGVNHCLSCGPGGSQTAVALIARLVTLGPAGWWAFFRYSCLFARATGRIKAGLWAHLRGSPSSHPWAHGTSLAFSIP